MYRIRAINHALNFVTLHQKSVNESKMTPREMSHVGAIHRYPITPSL